VRLDTAEGVDAQDLRSAFASGGFTAALVDAAIDAAERVWQNKRCLELKVEPPGKEVDAGSETDIKVKLEHKAFDEEVKRDIKAALAGTEKVKPLNEPVPAPADFKYTATKSPQGEGTITFRSVSNRGIAERTETYKVVPRLLLDVDASSTAQSGPITAVLVARGKGLKVKLIPVAPPEGAPEGAPEPPPRVSISGNIGVEYRSATPGCTGSGRKSLAVDSDEDASATVVGEGEQRRLRILLRTEKPGAKMSVRLKCFGTTANISVRVGMIFDEIPAAAALEIPIAGGRAERSGNVGIGKAKYTYTLRREKPAP
jgi:hypothetical protein